MTVYGMAEIAPSDLHVPLLGQLAPAQLRVGDFLKLGPLKVVGFDTALGRGPFG